MKPLAVLYAIFLFPIAALAQSAPRSVSLGRIAPIGIGAHSNPSAMSTATGAVANDTTSSRLEGNIFRAAAAGAIVGGVIGAVSSRHQPAEAGFTHTPAVLFVITYGGLGALLGIIAGTFLPGS